MDDQIETAEPLLIRRPVISKEEKTYYPSRGLIYFLLNLLFLSAVSVFLVTYLKDHGKRSQQVIDINIKFSDETTTEDPSIVTLLNGEEDPEIPKVLSRQYRHLKTLPSDNSTFSSRETIDTSENSTLSQHRIVACYDLNDEKEPTDEQLSMLTHIIFYPMEIYSNGTITLREDTKEKFERLVKKAKQFNVKVMFSTVLLRVSDMKMVETDVAEEKEQNETVLNSSEVKESIKRRNRSKMSFTFYLGEPRPKGMAIIMMKEDRQRNFLNSILDIIELYNLDGVDVHWRWSQSSDHEAKLILLCKKLREKLTDNSISANRTYPFTISIATELTVQDARIKDVSKFVDFFNIEAGLHYLYTFGSNGFGEANLFAKTFSDERSSIETALKIFSCLAISPEKLNLVIRFSHLFPGYESVSIADCDRLKEENQRLSTGSLSDVSSEPFECVMARNPFGIQMAEKNLKEKLDYLKDKNIGGETIWRIVDDKDNRLLKMIKAANLSPQEKDDAFMYDCTDSVFLKLQ